MTSRKRARVRDDPPFVKGYEKLLPPYLELDVGGFIFPFTRAELMESRAGILRRFVRGELDAPETLVVDDEQKLFFNRNGRAFEAIAQMIHSGSAVAVVPSNSTYAQVADEVRFFFDAVPPIMSESAFDIATRYQSVLGVVCQRVTEAVCTVSDMIRTSQALPRDVLSTDTACVQRVVINALRGAVHVTVNMMYQPKDALEKWLFDTHSHRDIEEALCYILGAVHVIVSEKSILAIFNETSDVYALVMAAYAEHEAVAAT